LKATKELEFRLERGQSCSATMLISCVLAWSCGVISFQPRRICVVQSVSHRALVDVDSFFWVAPSSQHLAINTSQIDHHPVLPVEITKDKLSLSAHCKINKDDGLGISLPARFAFVRSTKGAYCDYYGANKRMQKCQSQRHERCNSRLTEPYVLSYVHDITTCHLLFSSLLSAGDVIGAGSRANSDRHVEVIQCWAVDSSV